MCTSSTALCTSGTSTALSRAHALRRLVASYRGLFLDLLQILFVVALVGLGDGRAGARDESALRDTLKGRAGRPRRDGGQDEDGTRFLQEVRSPPRIFRRDWRFIRNTLALRCHACSPLSSRGTRVRAVERARYDEQPSVCWHRAMYVGQLRAGHSVLRHQRMSTRLTTGSTEEFDGLSSPVVYLSAH